MATKPATIQINIQSPLDKKHYGSEQNFFDQWTIDGRISVIRKQQLENQKTLTKTELVIKIVLRHRQFRPTKLKLM